ncbi:hypothetical protein G9A89_008132 [Geosiphon pyriformis]|nr:hypothetical protein G9A89_008132 [Geosiphon pyriformis]
MRQPFDHIGIDLVGPLTITSGENRVNWHKVKGHSGVKGNKQADVIASSDSLSSWFLPFRLDEHFLVADGVVVSGNSRHFVQDVFHSISHARWKIDLGVKFLGSDLAFEIDWLHSSLVWHLDLHMATGFTSKILANLLDSHVKSWKTLSGLSHSSSSVLHLLLSCVSDSSVLAALHKGFVFNDWFCETVLVFHDSKMAGSKVVEFACSLGLAFRDDIWLVYAKHCAYMKKNRLISLDGSIPISLPDHVFSCPFDATGRVWLVEVHVPAWKAHLGLFCSSLCVSQLFSTCFFDVSINTALYKGFIFKKWYHKSVAVFRDSKIAAWNIVAFVHEFCLVFCDDVWLVHAKH